MIADFEELNARSCACTEALKAKLDGSNGKQLRRDPPAL